MAFFAQPGPDPYRSQAGQLGQALAQGIGVHFQRGQMQQQQGQLAKALFGDQAQQYAELPVEQQLKAAKMFEQQKNQRELSSMLSSIYGSGGQGGISQMDSQNNPEMQQPNETNMSQPAGQNQPRKQPSDAEIAAITLRNPALGKILQQQKNASIEKLPQASKPINPEQLKKIQTVRATEEFKNAVPLKKYQLLTDSGVSKENAEAESKIAAEQEKPTLFEDEASKLAAQSSSKYRDKVVNEYEAAKSSDLRLTKMIKKAESGKLSTPMMIKTLDYFGIPLSVLNNPSTEEYAKLENDYVRDVSSIFPGAIKNFEIESYLKTIPRLLNSDEGKLLVAKNLQLINKAKTIKYEAMKNILEQNKGVVPRNLDIAINDATRNQMEEIKEEFVDNTRDSLDKNGPTVLMIDSDGTKFDVPTRHIEEAIKNGLTISNE